MINKIGIVWAVLNICPLFGNIKVNIFQLKEMDFRLLTLLKRNKGITNFIETSLARCCSVDTK